MSPTTNLTKSDEDIKVDVIDELAWDSQVDASKVEVTVANGVVTLSGSVPTYSGSTAASADAWSVGGVVDVINNLTVSLPSVPPVPTDAELKANAITTLDWNPDLDSSNIDPVVEAGVIKLTGTTPSHWEKSLAEMLVSGLRGAVSVTNEIAVTPTRRITDEAIADDITAALDRSVLIDADRIDVTVSNGHVTLSGSVPTAAARQAAFRAANRTLGVISVTDNLSISP